MSDWWSCDGTGGEANAAPDFDRPNLTLATRRSVLVSLGSLFAGWVGHGSALGQATLTHRRDANVLVVIFMRGGADGLNMVIPYAEDAYYRARPTLAIAQPNQPAKVRAIDLNGFFALHPSLQPLLPLYESGQMSIVHACGSNDETRSHFQAMSTVERGAPRDHTGPSNGWLARHLLSSDGSTSPLRAIAFGDTLPDSLRGATAAIALQSLDDFALDGGPSFEGALAQIYGGKDAVAEAGQQTLAVLKTLRNLDVKSYKPANRALYPAGDLGEGLKQVACLIKANAGLEVACLDKGGWDTHVAQGADTGWQAMLMQDLSASIHAFCQDLGPELSRVTVIAMSEFGRRVAENAGLGTDHGRATPMYVIGGGLAKSQVYANWPGLEPNQLDEVGDLRVTTDYRSVLGGAISKRLGNNNLGDVFPGWAGACVGLFS